MYYDPEKIYYDLDKTDMADKHEASELVDEWLDYQQ